MTDRRLVDFYRLIPHGRPPKRAERSAAGILPARAMRYCDALTSATGYGYWVFPPLTFRLLWDGEEVSWSYDDTGDWLPLSGTDSGAVQFPDFSETFNKLAPDYLCDYSPPFLTALPEPGAVQIWTGLLVRTRPGWSLNVRSPVNLPPTAGLTCWEGLVESDIWFGPLFNNFRLTQTGKPVILRAGVPFLQVQPVPQVAYRDNLLNDVACHEPESLTEADWRDLSTVLLPNPDREARQGQYAVSVRKRRLCPVNHADLVDVTGDGHSGTPAFRKPST